MSETLRDFLAPLGLAGGRSHVSVYGGLLLLCVYLYFGHHSFFTRRFGARWRGTPYAEWAAHAWQFSSAFVLLFVVPLTFWLGSGRAPSQVGLALGDWRFGLASFAVLAAVLAGPLWVNAGTPAFQAEYPLAKIAGRSAATFAMWEIGYLVYYIAWEFFFRGFWQLGQVPALGIAGAMALQASVSTVMHIGKPAGETFSAVVAGVVFGLVALKTGSFVWVLLLHWYVGAATDFFCLVRSGRWGRP